MGRPLPQECSDKVLTDRQLPASMMPVGHGGRDRLAIDRLVEM